MPPLVFAGECDDLKDKIAAVTRGEAFLLQGGDCAETFDGVTADNVRNKLRVLLQMAVVLTYAASVPVVKLGRLAGQYAKPRSSDIETRDGVTLPAYRGDAVNGFDFTPESRIPDPQRLVDVYNSSAATLNLVRAFVTGGYADLRQVHTWNTDFVRELAVRPALRGGGRRDRARAHLHEGDRRRPRRVPPRRLPLQPRGAAAGVRARADPHRLAHRPALRRLGPLRVDRRAHPPARRRPRRAAVATSRTRSASSSARRRPPDDALALRRAAQPGQRARAGSPSSPASAPARSATACRRWSRRSPPRASRSRGSATRCTATPSRRPRATRPAASTTCIEEVQGFFDVHRALGTWPGGVHVELTGDDVTECVGGGEEIDEVGLAHRYESVCDPRLNRVQSLELAFLVAEMLRKA